MIWAKYGYINKRDEAASCVGLIGSFPIFFYQLVSAPPLVGYPMTHVPVVPHKEVAEVSK